MELVVWIVSGGVALNCAVQMVERWLERRRRMLSFDFLCQRILKDAESHGGWASGAIQEAKIADGTVVSARIASL